MKNIRIIIGGVLIFLSTTSFAQASQKLEVVAKEAEKLEQQWRAKLEEVKQLKLEKIHEDLLLFGYPQSPFKGQIVTHSAMALEYVEDHEQAAWVYHIILPDIIEGNEGRTNDFRIDTNITTGSAMAEDYVIITKDAEGKNVYDGFGYDRGHLAPSADFRWHKQALSESYYYSNMSPQLAAFNREIWAELEDAVRNYVFRNERAIWIVTGGILKSDLPKIPRSVNGLTVPEEYFKLAYDPVANSAIAFVIPNQKSFKSPKDYAKSVREVEALSGINFFPLMPGSDSVETKVDVEWWMPKVNESDITPLKAETLPKNHFNTVQAEFHVYSGRNVSICGTVVNSHFSKAGNVLLNLDKGYPNQVFTAFIKGEDLKHFSYSPDLEFKNERVCITGKVEKMGENPAIFVTKDTPIRRFEVNE
jgi:endonuclease G, mitochondrial